MGKLPELLHPQGDSRILPWIEFQGHQRNKTSASGFAPQRMHEKGPNLIDMLLTQAHRTGPP
eukprot:8087572-Heterocapsa_arctica.AAC.1